MLLIHSENTDVYFNLAAEDHLLHQLNEDVLMLWQSRKAVVCGKHQNTCAEVNYGFCKSNNIDIARRLSGGGTVFHDSGNINFTFIQSVENGLEAAINYRRFLEPVRAALLSMGIETSYSERNDLLMNGKKISGNAEHVLQRKLRVLHHGTLLYNSDLQSLGQALHSEGTYMDRAVKSVRSTVTNIAEHLTRPVPTEIFLARLYEFFLDQKHTYRYVFSSKDLLDIEKLQNTKYATEAWITGYSPSYEMRKTIVLGGMELQLFLKTEQGSLQTLELKNMANELVFEDACASMRNEALNEANISAFLHGLDLPNVSENDTYLFF